jgi:hypothetical protein
MYSVIHTTQKKKKTNNQELKFARIRDEDALMKRCGGKGAKVHL